MHSSKLAYFSSKDNGYAPHMDSTLIKEQIMLAFPHVSGEDAMRK